MGSVNSRNFCINGTVRVRDVSFLQSADVETWSEWIVGTKDLDASRAHCQAVATSEMAIEFPPEEQVKGEDLVAELLKSLYGTRKAAHNWEKKWQSAYRNEF